MRNPAIRLVLAAALASPAPLAAQTYPENVSAAGNEPFWRVDVADGQFTLRRPDFDTLVLSVTSRTTTDDGGLVIEATMASPSFRATLTLSPGPCSDTMADQTYPFSAEVAMGDSAMTGCGGDPATLLTAVEEWTVTEIAGAPVPEGLEVTIGFDDDGGLFGTGGCNRMRSTYEITGEGLSLGAGATTMMACPEEIMTVEQNYLRALESVTSFDIGEDGELILRGPEGPAMVAVP